MTLANLLAISVEILVNLLVKLAELRRPGRKGTLCWWTGDQLAVTRYQTRILFFAVIRGLLPKMRGKDASAAL